MNVTDMETTLFVLAILMAAIAAVLQTKPFIARIRQIKREQEAAACEQQAVKLVDTVCADPGVAISKLEHMLAMADMRREHKARYDVFFGL